MKSISKETNMASKAAMIGSTDPTEAGAREWQRSECNRVVDRDDREKCLKRVDR